MGSKVLGLPFGKSLIIGSKVLSPHLGESKMESSFLGEFKYGGPQDGKNLIGSKILGPHFGGV